MRFCWTLVVTVFVAGAWLLVGSEAWAQTTVNFSSASIDLGTNLPKLANLEPWSHTIGTDWDENFTIGGIIGAPNVTVIPEVKAFGATIIPEVKADTRTGARMQGRVWGDVGLEFSAEFITSGLEPGTAFNFAPTLSYDATPEAGSFIKFATTTGVVSDSSFTEAALELPAVDAQIDFFFNLDVDSTIDYGLFPLVPYNSTPFSPGGIHLDQRNDADKSLLRFQASLDPDDNNGSPLPPTFTAFDGVEVLGIPLTQQIGQLDSGEFLFSKQFSTKVENKDVPNGPKPRIDLGEIQVVNPFGTGGDLLGTSAGRNLEIATSIVNDTIGYTAETALFRMGLDLDGIAAGLATGQSFTRIEEDIKVKETKIAEIVADLIDLKYGPEVGFRETVEISPEFDVTLNFRDANGAPADVAIDDNGNVSLMSTFRGRWDQLPEIALLSSDVVNVEVSFDELTGEQSKRGAFFLTDYLEFTLLELESLKVLGIAELTLPPVFRTRTSLLGDLIGELELEAYTETATIPPFALNHALAAKSFMLSPTPPMLAYLTNGGSFDPDRTSVRRLSDHSQASGSAREGLTVVIGKGDTSAVYVGDLAPLNVMDGGHMIETEELMFQQRLLGEGDPVNPQEYSDPRQVTKVMGLQLVDGSNYSQSGSRTWEAATIRNDGTYNSTGDMTRFSNPGGTLFISGSGSIEFDQRGRLDADVIVQAQGHTLRFDTATGFGLSAGPNEVIQVDPIGSSPPVPLGLRLPDVVVDGQRLVDAAKIFHNAGTLDLAGSNGEIYAGMEIVNTVTGQISVSGIGDAAAQVQVTTPDMTNNGAITVGALMQLDFSHPDTNLAQQLRGDGLLRVNGGAARFLNNVTAYAPEVSQIPFAASQTFEVVNGGSLEFKGNTIFYAKPTFEVGAGSELTFNGLGLDGTSRLDSKFGPGAPIDVVNDGRVVFNSGSNNFKLSILELLGVGEEPTVIPIGLENRGVVEIRNNARLTLDAEIRDYRDGGATFDAGGWEIIGPTPTSFYNNLTSNDSNVARLNLKVDRVEVGDNFLTVIKPGASDSFADGFTDTYDVTAYDTFMSTNRSEITLSGRAKFEYLNTVQRNEGALKFDNRQHFQTVGGLINTGQIEVTRGSLLDVAGRLLVRGPDALLHVGEGSGLSVAGETVSVDNGATTQLQHVVVDGGTLVFDANATNNTALFTQRNDGMLLTAGKTWIVRDNTVENEDGSTTTNPGNISLNIAVGTPGVIRNDATVIIEGNQAFFNGLESTLQYQHGSLTLRGGKLYESQQSYFRNAPGAETILQASQLIVPGEFRQEGLLTIDSDSYLRADLFNALEGMIELDGVIETGSISLPSNVALIGSGQLSGELLNAGTVEPGNSLGTLQTFGAYTQDALGKLSVEVFGPRPGEDYDQLIAKSANLSGLLSISSGPDILTTAYGERLDVILTDDGITGQFDIITGAEIDAEHRWVVFYETDRVSLAAARFGDANFNGVVEFSDFLALAQRFDQPGEWSDGDFNSDGFVRFEDFLILTDHFGQQAAATASVPEPRFSFVILLTGTLLLPAKKRKRRPGLS